MSYLLGSETASIPGGFRQDQVAATDCALDVDIGDLLGLDDAVGKNDGVLTIEEEQDAIPDATVRGTELRDAIAEKVGDGAAEFMTRSGEETHVGEALCAGLGRQNVEPILHGNASIRLRRRFPQEKGRTMLQWFIMRTVIKKNLNQTDRKSTRLNSSHRCISYAVFC